MKRVERVGSVYRVVRQKREGEGCLECVEHVLRVKLEEPDELKCCEEHWIVVSMKVVKGKSGQRFAGAARSVGSVGRIESTGSAVLALCMGSVEMSRSARAAGTSVGPRSTGACGSQTPTKWGLEEAGERECKDIKSQNIWSLELGTADVRMRRVA